ncbi:MAG TPA: NADH-quinone oxidoreductase subunit NuoE [Desulfobacteraceae bacterium]|nr:NADH-quinone oxidoreductase subunit NuoE [Desulfobacteraceae bacterium]HPJ67333.1 NADH-quinone oxidoreductase subunit NuoE [Desulfobacteraceae bacterium]HPQ28186.1 NADH-quinone oxidoreductase subunit NuoE [Desulfobacteraceae bacterium]
MRSINDISSINPDLTSEVMSKIDSIIERYKDMPGCLIPVLEDSQRIVGYLPVELQEYISEAINIPESTIYGVVTFYSYFTMIPKGRHVIKVCMGTACYVKGIGEVLQRLESELKLNVGGTTDDRRFSLEAVRCLGACGLAPVVVIDNDTHGGVTPDKLQNILVQYQ